MLKGKIKACGLGCYEDGLVRLAFVNEQTFVGLGEKSYEKYLREKGLGMKPGHEVVARRLIKSMNEGRLLDEPVVVNTTNNPPSSSVLLSLSLPKKP